MSSGARARRGGGGGGGHTSFDLSGGAQHGRGGHGGHAAGGGGGGGWQCGVRAVLVAVLLLVAVVLVTFALVPPRAAGEAPPPAADNDEPQQRQAAAGVDVALLDRECVELHTTAGVITFRLFPDIAPKTVTNFIALAEAGLYNNGTFYRAEPGFCLQGGAVDADGRARDSPLPAVPLEYKMPNHRGMVSTARTADPNSATSEFSIMLGDNSKWLGPGGSDPYGYAVFARVSGGWDVVERIMTLPRRQAPGGTNSLVPPVVIRKALHTHCAEHIRAKGV